MSTCTDTVILKVSIATENAKLRSNYPDRFLEKSKRKQHRGYMNDKDEQISMASTIKPSNLWKYKQDVDSDGRSDE